MEWITDPQAWIALATLTVLEIVLGIDNIIFISILSGKLPDEQRARGRRLGLAAAMGMRLVLLASLQAWWEGTVAESGFVRGYLIGEARGQPTAEFFTRPLSLAIIAFIVLSLFYPLLMARLRARGTRDD